jgi:hypothetical protein
MGDVSYEVVARIPHERGASTPHHWRKIGIAHKTKDGRGFSLVVDAVPLNWDGRLYMFEDKPTDRPKQSPPPGNQDSYRHDDGGDDVPF